MDHTIYIVNHSTQVTDAQVQEMAAACAMQIALHVAPAHFSLPVPVLFLPKDTVLPTQARVITVMDECDDPQALGYHTQDGTEHIWGVVGTSAALANGSQALTGALSVSSILSHEVAEMYLDPFANFSVDSNRGFSVAYECGDPVQGDSYEINGVSVSNFVTGPWFNPMASPNNTFDHMGKLTAPFTMDAGGYWVQTQDGQVTQQFGEEMPDWLRQVKAGEFSRTSKVSRALGAPLAGRHEQA
jgi:hypothetical protein